MISYLADLPTDADFWLNQNLAFLARCDRMLVLQLRGGRTVLVLNVK
jgi:hypothetical protein